MMRPAAVSAPAAGLTRRSGLDLENLDAPVRLGGGRAAVPKLVVEPNIACCQAGWLRFGRRARVVTPPAGVTRVCAAEIDIGAGGALDGHPVRERTAADA